MLLLLACTATDSGEKPATCASDDECAPWGVCEGTCVDGDRNNAADEAVPLTPEVPAEGLINPAGDADWYAFSSVGGEFIRARTVLTGTTAGHDTVLILHDPLGTVVATADGYPTGGGISNADAVIYAYLSYGGIYTLEVRDAGDAAGTGATGAPDYTYTVDVEPWSQHTSEDGAFDLAPTTADSWSAIGVYLDDADDTDTLRVTVPWDHAPFTLASALDPGGSVTSAAARLSDADGQRLATLDGLTAGRKLRHPSVMTGEYTVTLSGGDPGWFFVFLEIGAADSAAPEEVEDNDTRGAATAPTYKEKTTGAGDAYQYAHLWGDADGGGDDDWFVIGAPYASTWVTVCAQGPTYGAGADLTLDLYDDDGALLGTSTDHLGEPDAQLVNVPMAQPGAVRIRAAGSDPADWYQATVYLTSFEVDPYEDGGYACP